MPLNIRLTPAVAEALWRSALRLEVGIKFPIDPADVERVKEILYDTRKSLGDETLSEIMLCVGDEAKEILLVKKSVEAP